MKNRLFLCITLGAGFFIQAEAADKIYTWQAEDGTVIFSDVPPPGDEAQELDMPESTAPVPSQNQNQRQQQLLRESEAIDKRIDERKARRGAILKNLDEVRAQIARIKQGLEQGREPQPGELQHLAGGGTRLSAAYFERIERQENEMKMLEQQVSELLDELQTLR